jgi:hypothetical protein
MPAQLLHALFGEDVIAEIYRRIGPRFGIAADKAREKINREYRAVFFLGCQGPDIFYHNRRTRPVALEYGGLLHRRGYGLFTAFLLKMGLPDPPPDGADTRTGRREKEIGALGAYSLGFMTHAVLDRFCHPYIVYKSQYPDPAGGRKAEPSQGALKSPLGRGAHPFFERILDVLMLRFLRGREVSSWDQEGILAGTLEHPPPGLKELLCRALTAGFPERAGKDQKLARRIDNAFFDAARFYRLTDPQRTRLYGSGSPDTEIDPGVLIYLYPEQLSSGIDFLNTGRRPWYDPGEYPRPGEESPDTRSFPDIYAEAVLAAADSLTPCITEYLLSGAFPIREAAVNIGNGGLSLQDERGKPRAPLRTDPLPLERVLAEQAELRRRQMR